MKDHLYHSSSDKLDVTLTHVKRGMLEVFCESYHYSYRFRQIHDRALVNFSPHFHGEIAYLKNRLRHPIHISRSRTAVRPD